MTKPDSIFMAGISGMGMAPLALYLRGAGARVEGFDDAPRSEVPRLLESRGIPCARGFAGLPGDVSKVVYSSAVPADHPALAEARGRGLPCLRRGEMLARAASEKKLLAVAGSHGKTTTTAMLIAVLRKNHFPFSYILGGLFASPCVPPAEFNPAPWLAAEIDESDGTISNFHPEITLALNFDWDHPAQYHSLEALEEAFRQLFRRTRQAVLLPQACPVLRRLAAEAGARVMTFGPQGDYQGECEPSPGGRIFLRLNGRFPAARAPVKAGGDFNAANALAAFSAARHMGGFHPEGLAAYPGVRRRQTILHEEKDLAVYEDYAHHPSELRALFDYFKKRYPKRGRITVFQPHRYTRTAQYKEEFAKALAGQDQLFLLEVYAACEKPAPGGTSADLLALLPPGQPAEITAAPDRLIARLAEKCREPSVVLFAGAGDIESWARSFVAHLRKHRLCPAWKRLRSEVSSGTRLAADEPLAPKTTWKTGGPARYYAEPACDDDLKLVLAFARRENLPFFVLGRGSNLLIPEEGYPGVVLRLTGAYWRGVKRLDEGRLEARAGASVKKLCAEAARAGLCGFECLEGIPGTIGGALRLNAGAFGGTVFSRLESLRLVTPDGEEKTLRRGDLRPAYRDCPALAGAVVAGAVLRAAAAADPDTIRRTMARYAGLRKTMQPSGSSAGCVFRNPNGGSAGQIIERLGLKGRRVGGAEISGVHANFIINRGRASSGDILALMRLVRHEAQQQLGLDLRPEVHLPGAALEEFL